ncbi:MAG: hypothetical protein LBJ18_04720 [Rickettsiales bacterium]|nr:hypothetical protein [Rickettsiales bacterium]
MRKIFIILLYICVFSLPAQADIASSDYIRRQIAQITGITISANDIGTISAKSYLLSAIDEANNLSPYSIATNYSATADGAGIIATSAISGTVASLHNCLGAGGYKNGTKCDACPQNHYCPAGQNDTISCETVGTDFVTQVLFDDIIISLIPVLGKSDPSDCKWIRRTLDTKNAFQILKEHGSEMTGTCNATGVVYEMIMQKSGEKYGDGLYECSVPVPCFCKLKLAGSYWDGWSNWVPYPANLSGCACDDKCVSEVQTWCGNVSFDAADY